MVSVIEKNGLGNQGKSIEVIVSADILGRNYKKCF
jgi:hypothetical protein